MKLEDAWLPVDEIAGTAIDTFSYCVERGDGIFYPSKIGMLIGSDKRPFTNHIMWRAWECIQSLMDQGLDPLRVLIDRAHDKGMDFFADLRLSSYGGMNPAHQLSEGGGGFAHTQVRDHQFSVIQELVTDYPIEGVELDFPAASANKQSYFKPEDIEKHTPLMTDWVRKVSDMTKSQPGRTVEIGARVYPTETMNLAQGLDVRTWLNEGILDFVIPVMYMYSNLDPNMPFDWLIQPAHEADANVYGFLQHYVRYEETGAAVKEYPTPEIMRAAAANFWDRGVDGLYTWFMRWPLGDEERSILTELGDPELIKERKKHYVLPRRSQLAKEQGYDQPIPLEITTADNLNQHQIPFYIADDPQSDTSRIIQVQLRIYLTNSVSADEFTVLLNGQSLSNEMCRRIRKTKHDTFPHSAPRNYWLDFELSTIRPQKGQNTLEISLDKRPPGLVGSVTVEEVEIFVEYGSYASGLNPVPVSRMACS